MIKKLLERFCSAGMARRSGLYFLHPLDMEQGGRERARSCSEFLPFSRCWVPFISCTARRGNCSTGSCRHRGGGLLPSSDCRLRALLTFARMLSRALAITSSILALVHLRHNGSNWLAALFGLSAACIVYFNSCLRSSCQPWSFAFWPSKLAISLLAPVRVALIAFAVAFLPVIPGLRYMFHTSGIHVFSPAPTCWRTWQTLATQAMALILAGTVLLRRRQPGGSTCEAISRAGRVLFCAALGLIRF